MREQRINRRSKYLKFARAYLKEHGIQYRFRWGGAWGGGFATGRRGKNGYIQINMTVGGDEQGDRVPVTVRTFLSTLFHEVSHIISYRTGKYAVYHHGKLRLTTPELKELIRTALRAEVYTDSQAEKTMKKHFPDIPFERGYNEWGKKQFRRYFIAPAREDLERRLKRKARRAKATKRR